MLKYGKPVVIVIENAPYHSGIDEILNEPEFLGNQFWGYSHHQNNYTFNPIEHIWSVVKSGVKKALASKISEILSAHGNNQIFKKEFILIA